MNNKGENVMSDKNLSIQEQIQALLKPRTMPVQIIVVPNTTKKAIFEKISAKPEAQA